MLPRSFRLPSADIRRILRTGTRSGNAYFRAYSLPSPLPKPRYAVLVPKKIDKRASRRNRIKRMVREALRTAASPRRVHDTVVIVKANIVSATVREVAPMVHEVLPK